MKILLFCSSVGLAHIVRSAELLKYLESKNVTCLLACCHDNRNGYNYMLKNGIIPVNSSEIYLTTKRILGVGIPKQIELAEAYKNDLKIVESYKPDTIISDWRFSTYAVASKTKIPCFQMLNYNWLFLMNLSYKSETFNKYYFIIYNAWLKVFRRFYRLFKIDIPDGGILGGNRFPILDAKWMITKPLNRPSQFSIVGPLQRSRVLNQTKKIDILISFGGHSLSGLEKKLVQILASLNFTYEIIMPSLLMETHDPQANFHRKLETARCLITHGGSGSIYSSILALTPFIVIPQHLEHLENGRQCEDLGICKCISHKQVSGKMINDIFKELIASRVQVKLRSLRESMIKMNAFESIYNLLNY